MLWRCVCGCLFKRCSTSGVPRGGQRGAPCHGCHFRGALKSIWNAKDCTNHLTQLRHSFLFCFAFFFLFFFFAVHFLKWMKLISGQTFCNFFVWKKTSGKTGADSTSCPGRQKPTVRHCAAPYSDALSTLIKWKCHALFNHIIIIIHGNIIYFPLQHNFKKIRNNLEKSCKTSSKRSLMKDGKPILWEHWKQSYENDLLHNAIRTYHRLSSEHFTLTSSSRMRNYLAYDVLDDHMCEVMEVLIYYLTFYDRIYLTTINKLTFQKFWTWLPGSKSVSFLTKKMCHI